MLASFASKGPAATHNHKTPPSEKSHSVSGLPWYLFGGLRSPSSASARGPESEPDIYARDDVFGEISLIDFLEVEQKPAFVVDLLARAFSAPDIYSTVTAEARSLPIIYCNPFLLDVPGLLDIITGKKSADPYTQPAWVTYSVLRAWIMDDGMREWAPRRKKSSIVYGGMKWTATTVRRRWKIVVGDAYRHESDITCYYTNVVWANKAVGSVATINETKQPEPPQVATIPDRSLDKEADTQSRTTETADEAASDETPRAKTTESPPPAQKPQIPAIKTIRRQSSPPPTSAVPVTPGTSTNIRQSSLAASVRYDWTCEPPPPNLSPHVQLIRSVDWASTPLGPISNWTPALRHMANLLMASPNPAILFWGPQLNMLYNDQYLPLAGQKHPKLLGSAPWVGFSEAWDDFEPFFRTCEESGRGAMVENMLLFLNRGNGPKEEMYCSFSFTPVLEEDKVVGWYEVVFETTKQMITERRMSTLLKLGEILATSKDLKAYWHHVLQALSTNTHDIGFAVLYSVQDATAEGHVTIPDSAGPKRYDLEGAIGVPDGHPARATPVDVSQGRDGFTTYFRNAAQCDEPLLLRVEDGTLPESLVQGVESRAWHEPCDSVVISPIRPTTGHALTRDTAVGFLVIGLNSHRPYDEEYRTFINLLNRQITTSMASVLLLEEETKRGRTIAEQAAYDQHKIEELLRLRTKELEQSELQLKHFADGVPTGIFVLEFTPDNMAGTYRYRNEKWFELTGDTREDTGSWRSPLWQLMHPDDVPAVQVEWKKLMEEKGEVSFEFRIPRSKVNRVPKPPVDENFPCTWILCCAFSIVTEDGWLRSIVGSATDITAVKWAEGIQKRRMEDALEAKRQQENFIDVTSHEMRNPLSAIMISADDIITSLRSLDPSSANFQTIIKNSIDAAQTVLHCCQHQKRIVDDILTISKLDSGLFSIIPVKVNPVKLLEDLSKMFAGEYNAAGIKAKTHISDSFKVLDIDNVIMDSSRLKQILINLVTNSIKFTQYSPTRKISISIAASRERPTQSPEGIEYLPLRRQREDLTLRREWGTGDAFYLQFSVSDTGCGLSVDEKKLLFMRFSQAPRTMVHYGGSGLGLFICRELTELQGGGIGVESEADRGSTFAFFVKVRKSVEHELHLESGPGASSGEIVKVKTRDCGEDVDVEPTAQRQSQNLEQAFEQPLVQRRDARAPSVYTPVEALPLHPQNSPPETPPVTSSASNTNPFDPSSSPESASKPSLSTPARPVRPAPTPSQPSSTRKFTCLIVEDNKVNQSVMSKGLVKLGHTVYVANHGLEALEFLKGTKLWRHDTLVDEASPSTGNGAAPLTPETPGVEHQRMLAPHSVPEQVLFTPPGDSNDSDSGNPRSESSGLLGPPAPRLPHQDPTKTSSTTTNTNTTDDDLTVVLLDVEMPVMDGLTCVRRIRELEREGRLVSGTANPIRVIAITANARIEQVQAAMEAGMDDVVSKPFRVGELIASIERLVDKGRVRPVEAVAEAGV
ncbi:uncharacterized protein BKA78DRAFT_376412 [Phyllosticta capitalensis]|uniref:uncharacterized protein n=1 Tax=Phyllosticta capitalensis TaxID=121624 RepID=UPI003130D404